MQDGPINKIQQLMRYVTIKKKKKEKKISPFIKPTFLMSRPSSQHTKQVRMVRNVSVSFNFVFVSCCNFL